MKIVVALLCVVGFAVVNAGSKCYGEPKMYQGKMCATTTMYNDYHKGACGCGPSNNDNQFGWNHDHFVTAPNQNFFDAGGKGWCGGNCGRCIKLTTTGGFVDGQGGSVAAGQSHTFMVTNLCPNEYPNLSWCSQTGANNFHNQYGYHDHFDLENGAGQIGGIGWAGKNPEVTWEFVDCDQEHRRNSKTPSNSMFQQCWCSSHSS